MDSLPNEILERILIFLNNGNRKICRLVSQRWNQVTTRLCLSHWSLRSLHKNNIKNVIHIMDKYGKYINTFDVLDLAPCLKDKIYSFLSKIDFEVLPNLTQFKLHGNYFRALKNPPQFTLQNLRVLRLAFSRKEVYYLSHLIVKSAPNLLLLDATVTLLPIGSSAFWPLPSYYRNIPLIEVRLEFKSFLDSTDRLEEFVNELKEWKNVHVTSVLLHCILHTQIEVRLNFIIEQLFSNYADEIRYVSLDVQSVATVIHLPDLPRLEHFEIYNNTRVKKFVPSVQMLLSLSTVSFNLQSCVNPYGFVGFFSSLTLSGVKELNLYNDYNSNMKDAKWDSMFPCLEKICFSFFSNKNGSDPSTSYPFSSLRMSSLKHLKFEFGNTEKWATSKLDKISHRVNNAFSGYRSFDKLASDAEQVFEAGGTNEEQKFWAEHEKLRNTALKDMNFLESLYIDFPIDDAFATHVLLQLKPLGLLTISSRNLSDSVLCKLEAHHSHIKNLYQNVP